MVSVHTLPADIYTLFKNWAEQQPEQRIFAFHDARGHIVEDYSYRSFLERVDTLAARLLEITGLRTGDRVILAYQPGIEVVAALFACAKAGFVAVPTQPLSTYDFAAWAMRISQVVDDSEAKAWLTCSTTLDLLAEERLRKSQVSTDVENKLNALQMLETTAIAADPDVKASPFIHPIAFVQYTSGSTSMPKGVCVSHTNLIANCRAVVDHLHPVAVTWLPQHHDMGLIGYYIYVALSGGTTYGMAPQAFIRRPALWLELLTRYRATATSVPNFALELCLNDRRVPRASLEQYDLSSLRFCMVAAEPVLPETFNSFRQKFRVCGLPTDAIYAAYGLAEFTLAVTSYGRRSLSVNRRHLAQGRVRAVQQASDVSHALPLMSCGRPLGDIDLRIVDPKTKMEVTTGHSGEIWVNGAAKADGYWRKPDATHETFEAKLINAAGDPGTFLRTGDIGFIDEGEVFVCGRLKDMIIIRGQNIYPEDVEAMTRKACPDIRRNGVVAFAAIGQSETDITVVAEVPKARGLPDDAKIIRAIREGLQVPIARVVFVPPRSVARTSSGKVRRAHTRDLLAAGEIEVLKDGKHKLEAITDEDEGGIYELEVLKSRYGLTGDESFTLFDAGIDSLDLVVFLNWIKDSLRDRNASDLAARVNPRLLALISIRDLFAIAGHFEDDPEAASVGLSTFFATAFASRQAEERQKMLVDSDYHADGVWTDPTDTSANAVLVTGGTGFLGPHLLDAILSQSDANIYVIVRGRSAAEAETRLRQAFFDSIIDAKQRTAFDGRVQVVLGDLEAPNFGLSPTDWKQLAEDVHTVWHNGALVNYLLSYDHMRAANVLGTSVVLDLCFAGREKALNYVSTTFIFGWAMKDHLFERDHNAGQEKLDFGYSQSKWVAEQKVLSAMDQGLSARIFRPALITPAQTGGGGNLDITVRLLAFMIKHEVGVVAGNQVSFMPADITAANMVAIAQADRTLGQSFHVVRDDLETMSMITEIITKRLNIEFQMFDLADFVPQVVARCTRADPLYPLLDFLVDSIENISAMEFKRYESSEYRAARDCAPDGLVDPHLESVVDGILDFLRARNLI